MTPSIETGPLTSPLLTEDERNLVEVLGRRAGSIEGVGTLPLGFLRVGGAIFSVFTGTDLNGRAIPHRLEAAAPTACCATITIGHACARCLEEVGVKRFFLRAVRGLTLESLELHLQDFFDPLTARLLSEEVLDELVRMAPKGLHTIAP